MVLTGVRPVERSTLLRDFWVLVVLIALRSALDANAWANFGPVHANDLLGAAILVWSICVTSRHLTAFLYCLAVVSGLGLSSALAVERFGFGIVSSWIQVSSVVFACGAVAVCARRGLGATDVIGGIHTIALVPALTTVAQVVFQTAEMGPDGLRPTGTFHHRNSAGGFLLVAAIACIYATIEGYGPSLRDRLGAALYASAAILTASVTVIALLALMCLALVLVLRGVSRRVKFCALALISAGVVWFAATDVGQHRLELLAATSLDGPSAAGNSLEWRVEHWRYAIAVWRERPVLGFGYGSVEEGLLRGGMNAHNEYLRLLIETGVVGGLVSIVVLVCIAKRLVSQGRSELDGSANFAKLGLVVLAGTLTRGGFDQVLATSPVVLIASLPIFGALYARNAVLSRKEIDAQTSGIVSRDVRLCVGR